MNNKEHILIIGAGLCGSLLSFVDGGANSFDRFGKIAVGASCQDQVPDCLAVTFKIGGGSHRATCILEGPVEVL